MTALANRPTKGPGRPDKKPGRPTKKPGRPTTTEAVELSRHIVGVARELFFEFGYGTTTMDAVAARAGISKSSLYRRFPAKSDLFTAFYADQTERWTAQDAALVAPPITGDLRKGLVARIEAFLGAGLDADSVNLTRLIYAEASRFPEVAQTFYQSGFRVAVGVLAADLAAAAGRPDEVAAFLEPATLLQNTIDGFVLEQILQGRAEKITRKERAAWAARAVDQFLNGYRPPAA